MRRNSRFFLNHWRAKLASLVLATVLWFVIKRGIAYTPSLPTSLPPPPPANILPLPRA